MPKACPHRKPWTVRAVNFGTVGMKESLPQEVKYPGNTWKHFKYMVTKNTMLLNIELGKGYHELEYLKNLQIGGYGLVVPAQRLSDWAAHWNY